VLHEWEPDSHDLLMFELAAQIPQPVAMLGFVFCMGIVLGAFIVTAVTNVLWQKHVSEQQRLLGEQRTPGHKLFMRSSLGVMDNLTLAKERDPALARRMEEILVAVAVAVWGGLVGGVGAALLSQAAFP
jgi:hypothetical protein